MKWSKIQPLGRNYTVIIAEKPKAAKAIANALSRNPIKRSMWGVPYWVLMVDGQRVIVASTAGHMFSLHTLERGFPTFTYDWVFRWEVEKKSGHLRKFYMLLEWLSKSAGEVINACDYDIEGSVIGYLIIKYVFKREYYGRMKFSSLTEDELRRAFKNILPPDKSMVEAGLCRHELDWIWGINCSRALMEAYKRASGRKIILSAGRVQTPTLVEAINNYIESITQLPLPQYTVTVEFSFNNKTFSGKSIRSPLKRRSEAEEIAREARESRVGYVTSVHMDKFMLQPPAPFNLGDLQEEASRLYGYSPYKTQKIAESLYLNALISYPRTNSQKLPPTINHRRILDSLASIGYSDAVREVLATNPTLTPRQGVKTDPAHPAIYPTGKKPFKLSRDEERIYDLIVRRYLACFMKPAVVSRVKARVRVGSEYFDCEGVSIVRASWLKYYPHTVSGKSIPQLRRGDILRIKKVRIVESFETSIKRYNKTSLLAWMERVGIGTEATRAQIIETLFQRKYLESDSKGIKPTRLGIAVATTITKFFPQLTSVKLTREFEEKIELIRRGEARREDVVNEAKRVVNELVEYMKSRLSEAGEAMLVYLDSSRGARCIICDLPVEKDGLCMIHYKAMEKLRESIREWCYRTSLDEKSVLIKISKQKSVGKAVREVASSILAGRLKLL